MKAADHQGLEARVLMLAPTAGDWDLTQPILARAGIVCVNCADQLQLEAQLMAGAGAVLIAEEAVHGGNSTLAEWLGQQPPWSDLPVLVLACAGADSPAVSQAMAEFGNLTFIERPVRAAALVSAVRSALRARQRQYQLQGELVQRERSAERLDMAMAAANAGSWQINLTTGEFSASDRAVQLHGLVPGTSLSHEQALACIHPDDRASTEAALQQTTLTGAAYRTEYRVLQPDGSVRWVSSQAERRGQGHHTCIVGLVQDVTERKVAELRLKASEERFRLASVAVKGIIFEYDVQTGHVERSCGLYEVLGYRPDETLPTAAWWWEHIHPDDHEASRRRLADFTGDSYLNDYRVRHKDGRWIHVEEHGVLLRSEGGELLKMVGCTTDVTARKHAEAEQQNAQRQIVTTLESITDAFTRFDRDWRVIYLNDAAERMNQRPRAETIGKTVWELFPALLGTQVEAEYRRCVAEQVRVEFDYHYAPFDQWVVLKCFPAPEGGLAVYIQDITERKRAEAELRASEARFRTLFQSMDESFCVVEMAFDEQGQPADYRVLEMNPAFEKHTGMSGLVGKSMRQAIPDLEEFWYETYGRVAATGDAIRFVRETGLMGGRWFDVFASRLGGAGSNKVAILFNDITVNRKAQETIRASEA